MGLKRFKDGLRVRALRFKELQSNLSLLCHPKAFYNWWKLWGAFPVLSWLKGARCFQQGDFRSAIAHYARGLSAHPRHPAALCARLDYAYCLYRQGELLQAVEQLRQVVSAERCPKDAFLLLTRILLIIGEEEEALAVVKACVDRSPEDIQALSSFGHVLISTCPESDDLPKLIEQLERKKSELSLEDEKTLLIDAVFANYELRLGDVAIAERLIARLLATGKAPFEIVLLRAERLLEQKRVLFAREQLCRAVRMAPRDPKPMILLAKSYLMSGENFNPDRAVQLGETACRLSQWRSTECIKVLMDAYVAKDDKTMPLLLNGKIEQINSARALDVDSIRKVSTQVELLRTLKGSSV